MSLRLAVLVFLFIVCGALMTVSISASRSVSSCLAHAFRVTDVQFQAAHSVSNADERQQKACDADKETYRGMVSCVQSVQRSNPVYGWYMVTVVRWQGTLSRFVQSHNDLCPRNRIAPAFE